MSNTRFNGRLKVAFSPSLYFDDISMTFPIVLLIRGVLYLPLSWCCFPTWCWCRRTRRREGREERKKGGKKGGVLCGADSCWSCGGAV